MYFCICELGVGSGSWCKIRWVVVKKFESHCLVWRACGPRSEGSSWIWGPRGLPGCCGEDEKLQTIGCGQRGAGVFPAPSGDSMQASVQLFDSGCGFQMGRNSDPKKSERWHCDVEAVTRLSFYHLRHPLGKCTLEKVIPSSAGEGNIR